MKNSLKKAGRREKIFLLLSVLAVVAVSGCVSLGNLFGSGETTVEASNDVMAVSDSTVIPTPPILTGDIFTTSFIAKNLDDLEDAQNVKVRLYDWGACEPSSCTPAKSGDVGWDVIDGKKSSYSASFGAVSPRDIQQIECQFKAPSAQQIGGIAARCPIRYKLTYDFSGVTTTELNVISNTKFHEMQRAGQTPVTQSVQSKSRGPIKVDFSFGVNQPVRTSAIEADPSKSNTVKIPMYIRVENKGSGKIVQQTTSSAASTTPTGNAITVQTTLSAEKCKTSDNIEFDSGACFGNKKETYFCNNGNIEYCGKNKNTDVNVDDSLCKVNKGCVKSNTIPSDSASVDTASSVTLKITVPKDLVGDCTKLDCDGYFNTVANGDNCELTLNKKVDFVKDKSQVFRCELTSPEEKVVTDLKTYTIQSEAGYTYQIDNDFSVAISPMAFG